MAKKKAVKKKEKKVKIEISDALVEIQARFDALESKLDSVMSRIAGLSGMISTEKDPSFKTHATVTKKPYVPHDKDPRERKMYSTVCADCKKECQVPFVPKSGRPVYCKICYGERRKEKNRPSIPPREEIVAQISKTLNVDITPEPKAKPAKKAAKKGKAKKPAKKISKATKTASKKTGKKSKSKKK